MIIEDLDIVKRLIAEKEGGLVEFKETTGQLERGMETLCAFLNGNGGTVLFGVNDKGKIIGQDVSDKTRRDIADAINRLEPVAMVQISYAPLPDSEKKVIIFRVEDSRLIIWRSLVQAQAGPLSKSRSCEFRNSFFLPLRKQCVNKLFGLTVFYT